MALYAVGYVLTGARMPAGTTIAGVDVSGSSPSSAKDKVDAALSPKKADAVTLVSGEKKFVLTAADAGMTLDLDATVDQAGGTRSFNPVKMFRLFTGSDSYAPVIAVEKAKMSSVLANLSQTLDTPEVEPQITFDAEKPVVREPVDGVRVDTESAQKTIEAAYLISTAPQTLTMKTVVPSVGVDGVKYALDTFATPAMAGPVTLVVGADKVELPTTAFAPALTVEVVDGKLVPSIDAKVLAKPLTDSTTGIGKKARDATFAVKGGKVSVVESKPGVGLQPEDLATRLVPVLSKTGAERSLTIEATVVQPAFTTADAEKLGIKEQVSTFTTHYPPATYRDINQGRAAELINGTLLKPGETFSFNKIVGERTAENGFTTGSIISNGVFREELGGGVSQVATTTYNAMFFAGLKDVEHKPHSFYISRYPVGREATVAWPTVDLRFTNDTDHGILIEAKRIKSAGRSQGTLTVSMYGTKEYVVKAGVSAKRNFRTGSTTYDDTNKCVVQAPATGFDVDVYRTWYQNGKKVKSETKTANYNAADRVICGKKPDKDD
ncbi:VanW family protein [soil metagenome]